MKKIFFALTFGILIVSCSNTKETTEKPAEKKEEQKKLPVAKPDVENM